MIAYLAPAGLCAVDCVVVLAEVAFLLYTFFGTLAVVSRLAETTPAHKRSRSYLFFLSFVDMLYVVQRIFFPPFGHPYLAELLFFKFL